MTDTTKLSPEDINRMARDSGIVFDNKAQPFYERFAALAYAAGAAAERERLLANVEMPEHDYPEGSEGMLSEDYFTRHQLRETVAAAIAREQKRYEEVEPYLVAAADGSMSRNNSETLAAELLAAIRAGRQA